VVLWVSVKPSKKADRTTSKGKVKTGTEDIFIYWKDQNPCVGVCVGVCVSVCVCVGVCVCLCVRAGNTENMAGCRLRVTG